MNIDGVILRRVKQTPAAEAQVRTGALRPRLTARSERSIRPPSAGGAALRRDRRRSLPPPGPAPSVNRLDTPPPHFELPAPPLAALPPAYPPLEPADLLHAQVPAALPPGARLQSLTLLAVQAEKDKLAEAFSGASAYVADCGARGLPARSRPPPAAARLEGGRPVLQRPQGADRSLGPGAARRQGCAG